MNEHKSQRREQKRERYNKRRALRQCTNGPFNQNVDVLFYRDSHDDKVYCFDDSSLDGLVESGQNPFNNEPLDRVLLNAISLIKSHGITISEFTPEFIDSLGPNEKARAWITWSLKWYMYLGQFLMDWINWFHTPEGNEYLHTLSQDTQQGLTFLYSLGVEQGVVGRNEVEELGFKLLSRSEVQEYAPFIDARKLSRTIAATIARQVASGQLYDIVTSGAQTITNTVSGFFRRAPTKQERIVMAIKKELAKKR